MKEWEAEAAMARVGSGALLVATPALADPNFRRTVVYVISHDHTGGDGTAGVVLNRRSDVAVHTVLPNWADAVSRPQAMYVGGPVGRQAALAVGLLQPGQAADLPPAFQRVHGPVTLVNLDADPDEVRPRLAGLRIFAGHAGWGAGQLAAEVADGAWHVVASRPADVLAPPRADLWFEVLRRQPWPLTLTAYHPGDLSRN